MTDYYIADITSVTNYTAFGATMTGRNFSSSSYRYGFNNMEKDDEVKGDGNSYDFGGRIYDPRLGKFLSRDRYSSKFPHFSPYLFAANSPIGSIDVNGDSVYVVAYTMGAGDAGMFWSAALTRKSDIESSASFNKDRDIVVIVPIKDLALLKDQMKTVIDANSVQYGKTVEVDIYSHGGLDGPMGSVATSTNQVNTGDGYNQMTLEGWNKINYNWSGNGKDRLNLYGCNTAKDQSRVLESEYSFTSLLSIGFNLKGVTVSGQPQSSYPSEYTDSYETGIDHYDERYTETTRTYMVSRSNGALNYFSTEVDKMRSYKNGKVIGDIYQPGTKTKQTGASETKKDK